MSEEKGAKVTSLRARLREAKETPGGPRGGGHIPEDCPVVPLGVEDDVCWYLDGAGQMAGIAGAKHSKLMLHKLVSPHTQYFMDAKPEWAKTIKVKEGKDVVVDFRPDTVARDLMAACTSEGIFRPIGRVRGRGVWLGEDGDLVNHTGNGVQMRGAVMKPGRHGAHVYPRGQERPLPARDEQEGGAGGPAARIMTDLASWNWSRPEIDRHLLLGWICASFYCGALDWRPHGWITAPRASGKSTLFRYIAGLLHDPAGCVMTGDTSAAGVRAVLKHDALAVLFDDQEAGETPARIQLLVQLMRAASSGSLVLRGTDSHASASFTVRFMGLVNSILRPALTAQDLSRLMLLNLKPLAPGAREPAARKSDLGLLGQQLFRRMLDAWPRFQVELPRWKDALRQAGMPGRAPEQFGILLAAADVALQDHPADTDTITELCAACVLGTAADRAEELPEWQRCLDQITSTIVPAFRGGQQCNLGSLIAMAAMMRTWRDPENGHMFVATPADREDAQRVLGSYGLRVVFQGEPGRPLRRWQNDPERTPDPQGDGRAVGWLAVANSHAALNSAVFRRGHYAAASGTSGGWKAALETAEGAQKAREMRFGGVASRCVLVPLDLVLDLGTSLGEMME
jgi:energy-coupling factor transporter ATP-binding protein EcfA2